MSETSDELELPRGLDDVTPAFMTRALRDAGVIDATNEVVMVAIAMENARLINEQREALKQQAATAEILRTINESSAEPLPVHNRIPEMAHCVCAADGRSAEFGISRRARAGSGFQYRVGTKRPRWHRADRGKSAGYDVRC
jgi:hypothetical protein